MVEVELKFRVESLQPIQQSLLELGAARKKTLHQIDEYFENEQSRMQVNDCALRIRSVEGAFVLTYKGPKLRSGAKIRREVELPIGCVESANDLKTILNGCGYQVAGVVEKRRDVFSIPWKGSSIEACLDQVPGLGEFVELELVVVDDNAKILHARQLLESLAKELSLTGSITDSYLELIQSVRE